jgi:Spy/CpxP family protein refolding chaperone
MRLKTGALIAGIVAVGISAVPIVLQAQPNPDRSDRPEPVELNLTAAQKAQIAKIGEEARTQIDRILTTEQQAQVKAGMEQTHQKGVGQAEPPIQLTPEQNTQLDQIMQASRQRMEAVLTLDQLQKLRQGRPF